LISNKEFLIELIVDKLLKYRKKIQTTSISMRKTKYYDVFYGWSILYRRVRLSVISFNNCSCPCSSSKSARERLKKIRIKNTLSEKIRNYFIPFDIAVIGVIRVPSVCSGSDETEEFREF
jgi:hypothetical protein